MTEKSWKKKELRDAANTMKVIIENKDDFAKVLAEITDWTIILFWVSFMQE